MSVGSDSVLRRVLSKQMRLLNVNDNLNVADPDFPTDEVLKDALEELGFCRPEPIYTKWSGTYSDLIAILDANRKRLSDDAGSKS